MVEKYRKDFWNNVNNKSTVSCNLQERRKATEILYIFFGIHTANVVELSGRLAELQPVAG